MCHAFCRISRHRVIILEFLVHQFQTFESKVKLEVGKYAEWVEKVQHMPDPLVDVRVEPKFYIPDGRPYDGGWCRPQTDGPG